MTGRPRIIALGRPLAGARVTWAGLLALGGEAPARRGTRSAKRRTAEVTDEAPARRRPGRRPAGSRSGAVASSTAAVTACWRTARFSGGKAGSMHRLRKSRWARSSQCPLDSTPLPPSPWVEHQ